MKRTLLFSMVFIFYPLIALGNSAEFPIAWTKQFTDDKIEYQYRALSLSKHDNSILVAVRGRPDLKGRQGRRLWVWRLNSYGDKVQEIPVIRNDGSGSGKFPHADIKDLRVLDDGSILLLAEFEGNRASLVKLNKNGDMLLTKDFNQTAFYKIVAIGGNKFFLIGHSLYKPSITKIDAEGIVEWTRTVRGKNLSLLLDGLSTEDGQLVLLGNEVTPSTGPSSVWLGKLSADGKIIHERSFPGRFGSLARAKKSNYVVVYDKNIGSGQDIIVQAFTSNLKELWDTDLAKSTADSIPFQIAEISNQNLMIVGTQDKKLFIAKVGQNGTVVGNYVGDSDKRPWKVGLVSSEEAFFVCFSSTIMDASGRLRFAVYLIKFLNQ